MLFIHSTASTPAESLTTVNEIFDELGPTPRLCFGDENLLRAHRKKLHQALRGLTLSYLEAVGSSADDLRLDDVSHKMYMLKRSSPDAAVNAAHQGTGVRAVTVPEIMRQHDLPGIDLLKVDIEGSEMEVFSHADTWIGSVNAISIELHDRFRPGCSSVFFQAVEDFPVRLQRGEDVFTARDESMLRRPPAPLPAV